MPSGSPFAAEAAGDLLVELGVADRLLRGIVVKGKFGIGQEGEDLVGMFLKAFLQRAGFLPLHPSADQSLESLMIGLNRLFPKIRFISF